MGAVKGREKIHGFVRQEECEVNEVDTGKGCFGGVIFRRFGDSLTSDSSRCILSDLKNKNKALPLLCYMERSLRGRTLLPFPLSLNVALLATPTK